MQDRELARLGAERDRAFNQKEVAYQYYKDCQRRMNAARGEMELAWRERSSAREVMNAEFGAHRAANENRDAIWYDYRVTRDRLFPELEALRAEADREHEAMCECFEAASNAYNYGDRSEAPALASEGHEHKMRRNELNERTKELAEELRNAKAYAESMAPRVNSDGFIQARSDFEAAKARHEATEAEFKRLKADYEQAKRTFDAWRDLFRSYKRQYDARLAELKALNHREREATLDRAGVSHYEREDAKIVHKPDGTTQVYHGGLSTGDGYGHGHTTLDQSGRITYDRGAFEDHGAQNYTDNRLAVGTDMYGNARAKIRERKDGKKDIFYSNSGNYGDGLGHGHIVTDENGSVLYMRDEWQDKRQGQYMIDSSKDNHTTI